MRRRHGESGVHDGYRVTHRGVDGRSRKPRQSLTVISDAVVTYLQDNLHRRGALTDHIEVCRDHVPRLKVLATAVTARLDEDGVSVHDRSPSLQSLHDQTGRKQLFKNTSSAPEGWKRRLQIQH